VRSFFLLSVLALTLVSGAAADTRFTTIDDPHAPAGYTTPSGINDGGVIVGSYRAGTQITDPLHGFLLRDGSYMTIDEPDANRVTVALGINAPGDVVGLFNNGGVLGTRGFLLHQGTYTAIDAPGGGGFTAAVGINAQSEIVGRYQDAPGGPLHGFSLIEGHFNKIDVPGAGLTNVFGVNDRGDVVGAYTDAANTMHGFVLHSTGGGFETIDAPKASRFTVATGINTRNDIVGYYRDRSGLTHGFLLRNGQYATIDGPNGVGDTQALGINGRGDIVGTYSPPKEGFLLTATAPAPDPDELQLATAECKALKAKLGSSSFAPAYRTFGRCVSSLLPLEQLNVAGSRAGCTAEQNDPSFLLGHGGRSFELFYGTVDDAFGKCVLAEVNASSQAEQQGRADPSRTCRTERNQMGVPVFSLLYGRALGKCVSKIARTQTENELRAAAVCRKLQDSFSADSGTGKTFGQVWASDANVSNGFGECTASKASASAESQRRVTVSAAKRCLREQTSSAHRFKAKYGSFGRCVSRYTGKK
jgi:hypothetical protein